MVILLLTIPLLAGAMQGTAVARSKSYLAVLAADQEQMTGHGHGVLAAKRGCVILRDGLAKPTLLVFPLGYSLSSARPKAKLLDETGAKVATLGRVTTLNGGYSGQYKNDEAALDAILVAPIPDRCTYGYVFFGYYG